MIRRTLLAVAALLLAAGAHAQTTFPQASLVASDIGDPPDMMLGDPKAPITLIEYGSVACPICAKLNNDVMPALINKYIATGKVRLIYRPMLTGVVGIAAAGQMMAQCAGVDNYFKVNDAIMRGQADYYANGENDSLVLPVLLRIGKSFGMDDKAFSRCIGNRTALRLFEAADERYLKAGVDGTPTFFINGKPFNYKGGDIAEFDAAIAAAQ